MKERSELEEELDRLRAEVRRIGLMRLRRNPWAKWIVTCSAAIVAIGVGIYVDSVASAQSASYAPSPGAIGPGGITFYPNLETVADSPAGSLVLTTQEAAASGQTSLVLTSSATKTNGDILDIRNGGSNKATVDYTGLGTFDSGVSPGVNNTTVSDTAGEMTLLANVSASGTGVAVDNRTGITSGIILSFQTGGTQKGYVNGSGNIALGGSGQGLVLNYSTPNNMQVDGEESAGSGSPAVILSDTFATLNADDELVQFANGADLASVRGDGAFAFGSLATGSLPASCKNGEIIFDSTANKHKYCLSNSWGFVAQSDWTYDAQMLGSTGTTTLAQVTNQAASTLHNLSGVVLTTGTGTNVTAKLCSSTSCTTTYGTCTFSCTASVNTIESCTVNTSAVPASTTLTWQVTSACSNTNPVTEFTADLTTP